MIALAAIAGIVAACFGARSAFLWFMACLRDVAAMEADRP